MDTKINKGWFNQVRAVHIKRMAIEYCGMMNISDFTTRDYRDGIIERLGEDPVAWTLARGYAVNEYMIR